MARGNTSSSGFIFGVRVPALSIILLAAVSFSVSNQARAGDVTWTNGSSNSQWDMSSLNWNTGAWNNAAGDGAIFNATGVGPINVTGPINVNSLNFTVDGYSLTGTGPINIVSGSSTQTTRVVNVAAAATAEIFVPVNTLLGFQKIGPGTLELNAPGSYYGAIGLDSRNTLKADLLIGGWLSAIPSGTLRVNSSSVIPASTRVSVSNGYLDIGNNNVTLSELIFPNQNNSVAWNPAINAAACGVIGTGTLRVTGDINVIGITAGEHSSNTIAANVDLGGGTQVVRVAASDGASTELQFAGTLSNGSLLTSIGTNANGLQSSPGSMALYGNNTYTGSTILNGGTNVVTGTNATTSVKVTGSKLTLQGANGSFQSATTLQAVGGGTLVIDNDAAITAGGSQPAVPAAQNNNRIRNDAEIQLRDGELLYRGLSNAAASETIGSLNVVGGFNEVFVTANGSAGTATLTIANDLSLASRATLRLSTSLFGRVFVNGSVPAADATGILPRMIGSGGFLTYNSTTRELEPYSTYAENSFTPGANVSLTTASTVASSVNINALKRLGPFTTTIAPGQTLGIDSGMMINGFGTGTFTGGTIAFGSKPGVFFGENRFVINSALTGSAGLINSNSPLTLNGDLSGLSGTLSDYSGGTILATNTFPGSIEIRSGTFSIETSQTLAGQGPILLGVPQNEANLLGTTPRLRIVTSNSNAVIGRDIIVDNGSTNAAGVPLRYNRVSSLFVQNNAPGSQTVSGNITLNTSLRLETGLGFGPPTFSGNVSGPGTFHIVNARANFTGTVANAGGLNLGDQGVTTQVAFRGTGSGSGPITISGGNGTRISYEAGSLPGGPISVWNSSASSQPQIVPLDNSTISNPIVLGIGPNPGEQGNAIADVGAGITAEWAGPISGFSPLTKSGLGGLVLSSMESTYSGSVAVNAGSLQIDGVLPASSMTIGNSALLKGNGDISGNVLVNTGGSIAPGSSIGALETGNLSVLGSLLAEIDLNNGLLPMAADLLYVTGTVSLTNANLSLLALNAPALFSSGTYLLLANDNSDLVSGIFGTISGLPAGYAATIDYSFNGVDLLGRIGDGNDIAVTVTPEPASLVLLCMAAAACLVRRRRR
jgi:fibronectin-binding autotransporter adhesin